MSDELRITAFDHVVLNVTDVERSLAWYTGELGLEPIHVEEWRRGERLFPSVRVDEGTIIDLIGLPRSGENLDHFCLVVEPMDFDALEGERPLRGRRRTGDPLRRPRRRDLALRPRPGPQPRRAPLLLTAPPRFGVTYASVEVG